MKNTRVKKSASCSEIKKIYPDSDRSKVKVVFAGNGLFAAQVIENLANQGFPIERVLTLSDRKAGRWQKNIGVPVKTVLKKTEYKFSEYTSREEFSQLIHKLSPDVLIICDFGWIIAARDLRAARLGTINIHPSLLPKYRGPSPIQSAILAGETFTGVTIIEMDQEMDHGPIISQELVGIDPADNSKLLTSKLAKVGAKLLINSLPSYLDRSLIPVEQDDSQATYCQIIKKTDGKIDWSKSAEEIDCQVRAFNSWPRAYTDFKGQRLIIHAGKIEGHRFIPVSVQLEGRKIVSWSEFLNGQRIKEDEALKLLTD